MRFFPALISLSLISLFFIPSLDALPAGNPISPQAKGTFTTTFEADYTRPEGKLEEFSYTRCNASGGIISQGGLTSGEDVRGVEGEIYLPLAATAYSFRDNFDIFFKVGGAFADWQLDWYQDGAKVSRTDLESDWGVALGGGIRARLIEFKDDWKIGMSLSYLWFKTDAAERTTRDNTGRKYKIQDWAVNQKFWSGVHSANFKDDQNVHQWQSALYLSKPFNKFLPYLGIKYFDFLSKYEGTIEGFDAGGVSLGTEKRTIKTKSKRNVGVFAGIDYQFNEDIIFSFEGSFIDELAGSASVTLVF